MDGTKPEWGQMVRVCTDIDLWDGVKVDKRITIKFLEPASRRLQASSKLVVAAFIST